MRHFAVILAVLIASSATAAELLVEAESFSKHGGWTVDPQFMDVMGSPYLLAHGLGKPVADAEQLVEFPQPDVYRLWVRTKDWVPSHHPGRFQVPIDGRTIDETFGTEGEDWFWHDGKTVEISGDTATIKLHDLTGFDGRCDALFFTTDMDFRPSNEPDSRMAAWRRKLLGIPETPPSAGNFDVMVAGGGVAGCSAALVAARLGLRVALVQNRPVLGGNASSEIDIPPRGLARSVTDEVAGSERAGVIAAEKNIELLLGWHAFRVQKEGARITSVDAKDVSTNKEVRINAPVIIDCTGDGWIGYRAGAEYRMGREGRSEFDEPLAPETADKMTHGCTLYFRLGREMSQRGSPTRRGPL